jgi:hypothetical protein
MTVANKKGEMNYYRAGRAAMAARHHLEKMFGPHYFVKPQAANDITELSVMAGRVLELIERIAFRNRDAHSRKHPRPVPPLDREAFERFYRALRVSLEDPGLKYEEQALKKVNAG